MLAGFVSRFERLEYVIALLGVAIVILSGIQNLYKYQEHWISYRKISEELKKEKSFWDTGTGPYINKGTPEAFNALVSRVEGMITSEVATWTDLVKKP
jgi:hypothetical protein